MISLEVWVFSGKVLARSLAIEYHFFSDLQRNFQETKENLNLGKRPQDEHELSTSWQSERKFEHGDALNRHFKLENFMSRQAIYYCHHFFQNHIIVTEIFR